MSYLRLPAASCRRHAATCLLFALGQAPRRRQLAGAVLSLAGVALVITRGDPAALRDVQFAQGDLLMLLALQQSPDSGRNV